MTCRKAEFVTDSRSWSICCDITPAVLTPFVLRKLTEARSASSSMISTDLLRSAGYCSRKRLRSRRRLSSSFFTTKMSLRFSS